jgi:predicted O-methyltransferase YrrM
MSKIGKLFKAFGLIARQPSLLNHVLDDNEQWKKKVKEKYGIDAGLPVVALDTFLKEAKVNPYSFLDGTSLVTDLALLRALASRFTGCSYFEIGTWRGESVANVAEVAEECYTLNLPAHEMEQMGLDKKYIALHGFYSQNLHNVKHLHHNSLTFDFRSLGKKFDLIFVDGDHHYESVRKDTAGVFSLLKDEHSIIVWHDYASHPESVRWEVLCGILNGIPASEHKNLYQVSNTLCCIYSKKPLPSEKPGKFALPVLNFSIDLSIKRAT